MNAALICHPRGASTYATPASAPNITRWRTKVRQERRRILLKAIGDEQWSTVRCQRPHDLMDHALCHRQRAIADVNGQQQFGDRVDRTPDPVRGTLKMLDGLGVTDLPHLDPAEHNKEFIQLHLADLHMVQDIQRKSLELVG